MNDSEIKDYAKEVLKVVKRASPKLFWRNDVDIEIRDIPYDQLKKMITMEGTIPYGGSTPYTGKIWIFPTGLEDYVINAKVDMVCNEKDINIIRDTALKESIVELVIHELFHLHQYAKFWKYSTKAEMRKIEVPVMCETQVYIAVCFDILEKELGFNGIHYSTLTAVLSNFEEVFDNAGIDLSFETKMNFMRSLMLHGDSSNKYGLFKDYIKYKPMSREFYYAIKMQSDTLFDEGRYTIEFEIEKRRNELRRMRYVKFEDRRIIDRNGHYIA